MSASGAFLNWVTSEIAAVSTLSDADVLYIVNEGQSSRVTIAQLAARFNSGGSSSNAFGIIRVAGQQDVVADSATDVVTFAGTGGMTITTNAAGDVVTFHSDTGGGGGAVDSVNDQTGVVVLDQDDIGDGASFKQYSASDKSKLAAIAPNAVDAAGAAAAAPVHSVAGLVGTILAAALKTALALVKGDVGLGNVDNTSDVNKPVSSAQATAIGLKLDASTVGAASGVAPLGSDLLIPSSFLPALAITDTFTVSSQAAMLALTAQKGDVAVRTDLHQTFILATDPATTLANWTQLQTPTDAVLSVNGKTGAITLGTGDISESGGNLYHTDARVASAVVASGISGAAGTVANGDTITQIINKLIGNIAAAAGITFSSALTSISFASRAAITASTTVLQAFGQLQAQMNLVLPLWGNINAKSPVNDTLSLLQNSPIGFTINSLKGVKLTSGTLTLGFQINGVAVTGLTNLSITTTAQSFTATAAQTVAQGDLVEMVISASTGPPSKLVGTLWCAR